MNSHKKINKMLSAYVLGELSAELNQQVRSHLAGCQTCTNDVKRLEGVLSCAENVRSRSVDDNAVEAAKAKLLTAVSNEKTKLSAGDRLSPALVWRTIMKSKITKLAAAAVIMIGVVGLFIGLFHNGASPAYAIEQTIETMRHISTVHAYCKMWDGKNLEIWIKVNPETGDNDFHYALYEDGSWGISRPDKSWVYNKNANTIMVKEGRSMTSDLRFGRCIEDIWEKVVIPEAAKMETQESQDEQGNRVILVSVTGGRYVFTVQIDPVTKLPKRFDFIKASSGQIIKSIEAIYYDQPLPAGIFEPSIPEGAKVVEDNRDSFAKIINDPNHGMRVGTMTKEQASTEIAKEYFEAVIKQDWNEVNKLRAWASAEQWKKIYSTKSLVAEIVEIKQPYEQQGCSVGLITPVVIKFENGRVVETKLIVAFRTTDQQEWCVICGTWGTDHSL